MWILYTWIAAQIIVEVMPISSSSHLRLLEAWFKKAFSWDVSDYFNKRHISVSDAYHIFHLPTLLVVLYYFSPYWRTWFAEPSILMHIAFLVLISDAITICFYYLFKKYSISWPLIFGMCITALALLFTSTAEPMHLFLTGVGSMRCFWVRCKELLYCPVFLGSPLLPLQGAAWAFLYSKHFLSLGLFIYLSWCSQLPKAV